MTTREIFGMDHEPKIDTRTPEDLGYHKSPTRAERDTWRPGSGQHRYLTSADAA